MAEIAPTVDPGRAVKLASQVSGANTVDFTVPALASGVINALFQAVGTVTNLASALLVSLDGGTTFSPYITSLITAASPAAAVSNASANPIVAGGIYRINITALTGPADIWVTID